MSLNFEMRDMSDDYHKIDNSQNLIPPPNKSKLNIKKINSNTKNIIIISALFSYYIYSIITLHDFSYNHEKNYVNIHIFGFIYYYHYLAILF